jgi:hypothetical protein
MSLFPNGNLGTRGRDEVRLEKLALHRSTSELVGVSALQKSRRRMKKLSGDSLPPRTADLKSRAWQLLHLLSP